MTELVVTLPPRAEAPAFARDAQRRGANLLEIRNDLHADDDVDVAALSSIIPLLVSARGRPLAARWLEAATLVDEDVAHGVVPQGEQRVASHHADRSLTSDEALAIWRDVPRSIAHVKHVEPLGSPSTFPRLLETRARLRTLFSCPVTVLATGPLALPFRAVLAHDNALDYVALDTAFLAAPGQRLLDDVVRANRAPSASARLGIIGSSISASRSPRIHRPPFDRIDLPPDAPFDEIVHALVPYYAGFAVTSPFKRIAGKDRAVNTLVRRGDRYEGHNTDVDGARATLAVLQRRSARVIALGDGGATDALRAAATSLGVELVVMRRNDVQQDIVAPCVWTWPSSVEPPSRLRFSGVDVAVIAYGAPGRAIAERIEALGGKPLRLGPRWLIAQARGQRALWEDATQ